MAQLSYDSQSDRFVLENQPLERGDYLDVMVYDVWCRSRIEYSEQLGAWFVLARQTTDPEEGYHPVTILLRAGLIVRGAPGRWSKHH